ncbi:helix-turn-helix domain-containing protein [Ramlibacter sp.]|uniref:winged helix-turn-helix transcriptional regulator n=1 Tax=Ramlibacter sp. TaxID=1917967 RepID=UPI001806F8E8|nr:helix-turn-helix domain-containing protein [Ramlibacter sp.]MBA2676098.1 helix-turn-helix transcriptional regulator [Ramlibacter sp.]
METSTPSSDPAAHLLCGGQSCAQQVGRALQALSGRWAFGVLEAVYFAGGSGRFRELQRRIGRISQKELARQLVGLADTGVLRRVVAEDAGVRYEVTPEGVDLLVRLQALREWSGPREPADLAAWVRPLAR